MLYIRSFSFYLVYVVSAVLAGLFGCLVGPFLNLKPRIKMLSVWPRFSNWILCKTCCIRINIEGKENIPEGPFVIVSNHQGQWETFFYQYLFSFEISSIENSTNSLIFKHCLEQKLCF